MIEGLDYAIKILEKGAARHKFYASGDYLNAHRDVQFRHNCQAEACLGAAKLLKRKRSQCINERRKTVRSAVQHRQPEIPAGMVKCGECGGNGRWAFNLRFKCMCCDGRGYYQAGS